MRHPTQDPQTANLIKHAIRRQPRSPTHLQNPTLMQRGNQALWLSTAPQRTVLVAEAVLLRIPRQSLVQFRGWLGAIHDGDAGGVEARQEFAGAGANVEDYA